MSGIDSMMDKVLGAITRKVGGAQLALTGGDGEKFQTSQIGGGTSTAMRNSAERVVSTLKSEITDELNATGIGADLRPMLNVKPT